MKHFLAILAFILAVMLQLWLAPAGIRGDFALAALVVCTFLFEFWELAVFILFGIFLLNSSSGLSAAMLMLAIVPLAIFAARKSLSLDPWLGAAVGIVAGIIVFYAVVAPVVAFHAAGFLALDILACVFFGELTLYGIEG